MSNHSMQAVRFHDYGGPEVLVYEQVPRPQPQADQVLIRVIVAPVNPVDTAIRAGYFKEFMPLPMPWTPGVEAAGIVEAVGEEVTTFEKGKAVFGFVTGGYAEYAVALANELQLKPAHLTFEEAATVPMGSLTAWQALIETAKVQAGQRVLVHGGAGGVGMYAVQLAKWKGAYVIGTASSQNADYVRSLGADQVLDYRAAPFENVVHDMDVVLDTVGGQVTERSWQVLKPDGILVTVAARLTPDAGQAHGVRAASSGRASPDKLRQVSELLEAKKLTPGVGKRFTLAEARQAQELVATGHGRGRIILLTA